MSNETAKAPEGLLVILLVPVVLVLFFVNKIASMIGQYSGLLVIASVIVWAILLHNSGE